MGLELSKIFGRRSFGRTYTSIWSHPYFWLFCFSRVQSNRIENDKVNGSFSETEIKAQILNQNSAAECLIWGRDNTTWISYNQWQKQKLNQQRFW